MEGMSFRSYRDGGRWSRRLSKNQAAVRRRGSGSCLKGAASPQQRNPSRLGNPPDPREERPPFPSAVPQGGHPRRAMGIVFVPSESNGPSVSLPGNARKDRKTPATPITHPEYPPNPRRTPRSAEKPKPPPETGLFPQAPNPLPSTGPSPQNRNLPPSTLPPGTSPIRSTTKPSSHPRFVPLHPPALFPFSIPAFPDIMTGFISA